MLITRVTLETYVTLFGNATRPDSFFLIRALFRKLRRYRIRLTAIFAGKRNEKGRPRCWTTCPAQNGIRMPASYAAVGYIRTMFPGTPVIIEVQTFMRSHQVRDLLDLADSLKEPAHIIEYVYSDIRSPACGPTTITTPSSGAWPSLAMW